jgi:hypothetical protein
MANLASERLAPFARLESTPATPATGHEVVNRTDRLKLSLSDRIRQLSVVPGSQIIHSVGSWVAMNIPTVYLDTTIISAYWYPGGDVASQAGRLKTREWWDHERKNFSVWASGVTERELRAGEFRRQDDCVNTVRRLHYLATTHAPIKGNQNPGKRCDVRGGG